ncbi:MAG TPA: AI-2E family transporter, partial [Abditibacteriaceae bacterium]
MENIRRESDVHPLSYADLRRFLGLLFLLAISGLLIWKLGATLMLFAVVFLLAMILNPVVSGLQKRGIARGLAVVLTIVSLLGVLALMMWLIVPPILEQMNELVAKAPTYGERIQRQSEILNKRFPFLDGVTPETESLIKAARGQASGAVTWILKSTFGVIGALFLGIIALLLLVFTLSNPQPILAGFLRLVPDHHRPATVRSLERTMHQMTIWARATLINGAITGILTGVLLHFVGVQPALVFGTLAFFGEFVPNIGPLVAAVPALFVALGESPQKAGMALLAIFFVQQIGSNLLVPFIMGRQMELHPVTILFFALSMGALFGVVGAILAVPTAAL